MTSPNVYLKSAGSALPGPAVDNAELARRCGMDELWQQWADVFVGTSTRHLSIDLETGELNWTLTDLCALAGDRALRSAGLDPADVELVVLATSTPDQLMPATVNMVADRLGIDGVPTYQLQSGCTGAVQALSVATGLLAGGGHRNALVIGGDVCTKIFDIGTDFGSLSPAELVNVVLFGDGAGAAVLSVDPGPEDTVIRRAQVRLTGLNRPPGQTLEWFTKGDRDPDRPAASEDYKAIEAAVPEMAAEVLASLSAELSWSAEDLDYLLPPQLSGQMTAKIVERLGVPDAQEITCVDKTGNTGNALPFLQLEMVLPKLASGDRVLGVAIESSKWIRAGYALERM